MGWRITRVPSKRELRDIDIDRSFSEVARDVSYLDTLVTGGEYAIEGPDTSVVARLERLEQQVGYLNENFVSETIDVLDDLGYIDTSKEA